MEGKTRETGHWSATDYQAALLARIHDNEELEPHLDKLLYNWTGANEDLEWALTAPVTEIVNWAKAIS